MKNFWHSLLLLLLWALYSIDAQSSFYRHEYYGPVAPRYFRRRGGFGPHSFSHDLASEESRRKLASKKYSKPIPNRTTFPSEEDLSSERYSSGEYSGETRGFNSQEQDSHEYTIGTKIHVQHPITVPKKTTSSHPKQAKITQAPSATAFTGDVNLSAEVNAGEPPVALPLRKHPPKYTQYYDPDPFHVVPPPKSTLPVISATSNRGYHVYEPEIDDYQPPKKSRDRYKNAISKKQIEQLLEDQQKKLLDEALKLQLLNNPEFKEFLKAKEKHRYERDHRQLYHDDDGIILPPNPPPSVFLENLEEGISFTTHRPRRRPGEFKRSPKRKPGSIKPNRKYRSAIVIDV